MCLILLQLVHICKIPSKKYEKRGRDLREHSDTERETMTWMGSYPLNELFITFEIGVHTIGVLSAIRKIYAMDTEGMSGVVTHHHHLAASLLSILM